MSLLVYIYLTGFAAHIVLAHGVLSNPNFSKAVPSKTFLALFGAILWPLMLLFTVVEVIFKSKGNG